METFLNHESKSGLFENGKKGFLDSEESLLKPAGNRMNNRASHIIIEKVALRKPDTHIEPDYTHKLVAPARPTRK